MNTCLQALRLTTFANVLDSGRPVKEEVAKPTSKESKPQQPKENPKSKTPTRKRKAEGPPPRNQPKLWLPNHLFKKAKREHLCLRCLDPDHQIKDCPYNLKSKSGNKGNYQGNNGGYNPRGNEANNRRENNYIQNPNLIPIADNRNFNQN